MAFKTSDDQSPLAEINITPLVDVMLVLLVIFMITAPMLESGIPIQLPKSSAKALPKDESPVTLHLTRDGKAFLNRDELPLKDLEARIADFYRNRAKKEIFIRADAQLTYGFVAQTMATVRNAGVVKIGLVTLPSETK